MYKHECNNLHLIINIYFFSGRKLLITDLYKINKPEEILKYTIAKCKEHCKVIRYMEIK